MTVWCQQTLTSSYLVLNYTGACQRSALIPDSLQGPTGMSVGSHLCISATEESASLSQSWPGPDMAGSHYRTLLPFYRWERGVCRHPRVWNAGPDGQICCSVSPKELGNPRLHLEMSQRVTTDHMTQYPVSHDSVSSIT